LKDKINEEKTKEAKDDAKSKEFLKWAMQNGVKRWGVNSNLFVFQV